MVLYSLKFASEKCFVFPPKRLRRFLAKRLTLLICFLFRSGLNSSEKEDDEYPAMYKGIYLPYPLIYIGLTVGCFLLAE